MFGASCPMPGQMTGGSSGEQHLDLRPVDNSELEDAFRAAERVCELAKRQIPHEVEMAEALLIYPEGEGDAVTITESDMAELQPGRFLDNNIVDFYIRFLKRGLSPEYGNRFYFFNSFFFTRLLQSTAPTRLNPFKLDYEQLRKWTAEVNLFEKDYVFIPIVQSSHWSLVIVCHLSSLTRPAGETVRFPCVFHLDPLEGQHESFEGLIQSYVLEAWRDRFQASIYSDEVRAICRMKYVQSKVPQQPDNSHDCGLYVLNYIEAFLKESSSPNFSFTSSERGPHFLHPHFVQEVLDKRGHIKNLIHKLSGVSQKCAQKRKAIQVVLQGLKDLQSLYFDEGHSKTCIKSGQTIDPSLFIGQGSEIMYVPPHEDAVVVEHQQSTLISNQDNESFGGSQIEHMEYENRSDSLSPKHQHVEHEVQTIVATNFNGPIFGAMHVSTHEDAMQSSKILRLDCGPTKAPDLPHVEYERVSKSFSDQLQYTKTPETPFMGSFEVAKGASKRRKIMRKGKGKSMSSKIMTEEETWVLLSCKLEGGRFCKGSRGATHWNLISEEIGKKLGSLRSIDQCRLRYDTLLKAYKSYKKYCKTSGKTFSEITDEERFCLRLATTLSEEWYSAMDEIFNKAQIPEKCMKLSSNTCNDLNSLSSPVPNLPPISQGTPLENGVIFLDSVYRRVFLPTGELSSLNEDLQSTLLNLVEDCSWTPEVRTLYDFCMEEVCRRLAILQECEPRDILNYVLKLWELELVDMLGMAFEKGMYLLHMDHWKGKRGSIKFWLYKKIMNEVLCKNLEFQIYCRRFPIEHSSFQSIRVLILIQCSALECLNLREFPRLQILTLKSCLKLKLMTGWEVASGLGSLEIFGCFAYCDFPEVQYLFSLRELKVWNWTLKSALIPLQFYQFRQCSKLRRLDVEYVESIDIVDHEIPKELKSLEFLSLRSHYLISIQGLSGLQALTTLKLHCRNLRRVPELGCLKGLTHLDLSFSGIEDVVGVGELHLLTDLILCSCYSLKWLPFIGHLKALVYLGLLHTRVKEIPDREDIMSVKTLLWNKE